MHRIAAIISGSSLENRRGVMNAALCRIEHLRQYEDIQISIYFLKTTYEQFSVRDCFHKEIRCYSDMLDGEPINVLHKIEYRSLSRIVGKFLRLYHRLTKRRIVDWGWQKQFAKFFRGYDAITAHFSDAVFIADAACSKYSIPFFANWHGSDIHSTPFHNTQARVLTIHAIEHAASNFFVSGALLKTSDALTPKGNKHVLYNGVSECFTKYSYHRRQELRTSLSLGNEKVVTFAGNLIPVKNADKLPELFKIIHDNYDGDVVFWIIGTGVLEEQIRNEIERLDVTCCLWGGQPLSKMPDFFNCTDVLVLPSQNEGLPLVTLEAIACGANVVGTRVGGIPEAIGERFTVPYSDAFISHVAELAVDLLNNPVAQGDVSSFSWALSAKKEYDIINPLCK